MLKWLRRRIGILIAFLSILFLVYLLGPRPDSFTPDGSLPEVTTTLTDLGAEINQSEATIPGLKPDNEARIVWADPADPRKTPTSIVYLHGFGASQVEGRPVHTALAERFGCNLYLARLKEHGIDRPDAFKDLNAENYLNSALEAVAIGQAIGDRVILMATSTGASLALYIASQNPDVAAVLAYSPLIDTPDGLLFLPRGPWGRQLVSRFKGDPAIVERPEPINRYWSRVYSPEAYIALSVLVGETMVPEVFQQITCPVFVGIYYKSEEVQDTIVSVAAIREMFEQLGTAPGLKQLSAFPEAGDHVIACDLRSRDWKGVLFESARFLQDQLGLQPLSDHQTTAP